MNKQRLWIVLLTALVSFACSTALPAAGPCHDTCLPRRLFEPSGALSVAPVYTGELFSNTRGGITTKDATRYQALLDIGLTLDFKELGSPIPGKFFLLAQNTHGRGLTRDFVGDTQVLSNIDSFENIMQVSEYWWEFGLLDERLTVRLGKQDLNSDFLIMEHAGAFIQSSFGLSPSQGFPSYPAPSMAAVKNSNTAPARTFHSSTEPVIELQFKMTLRSSSSNSVRMSPFTSCYTKLAMP